MPLTSKFEKERLDVATEQLSDVMEKLRGYSQNHGGLLMTYNLEKALMKARIAIADVWNSLETERLNLVRELEAAKEASE